MQVRSVRSLEEWDGWRQPWEALLDAAAAPFVYLTHEWIETWWRHFGRDREVEVLIVEDEQGPAAGAALMRSRYRAAGLAATCLEFAGAPFRGDRLSRYMDLPVARTPAECLRALWGHLAQRGGEWDFANLRGLPADSPTLETLRTLAPECGLSLRLGQSHPTYVLPLGRSWDELLAERSSHFRYGVRYNKRRLEKIGDAVIEDYSSPEAVREVLPEVIALIGQSWQGAEAVSWASEEREREFFSDVLVRLAERGWLRLSTVRVDGRLAGYAQMYAYRGAGWFRDTVHHPDYKRGAPGVNLLARFIEWGCENGLRELEMGGGLQEYKRLWSEEQRLWTSAVIFHGGLRSRALRAAMAGSGLGREALRRLRRRGESAPGD